MPHRRSTTAALDPVASRDVRDLVAGMAREQLHSVLLCSRNLVAAQVRIHTVTPEEASLEDVYFALHRRGST